MIKIYQKIETIARRKNILCGGFHECSIPPSTFVNYCETVLHFLFLLSSAAAELFPGLERDIALRSAVAVGVLVHSRGKGSRSILLPFWDGAGSRSEATSGDGHHARISGVRTEIESTGKLASRIGSHERTCNRHEWASFVFSEDTVQHVVTLLGELIDVVPIPE